MTRCLPRRNVARAGQLGLAGLFLALVAGCATPRVTVHQPFAPRAQQHLVLQPETAAMETHANDRRCFVTFALPGSKSGPRAFVLYVAAPADADVSRVRPADATAARGFLIQEVGDLAGRTDFVAGTIEWTRSWLTRKPRMRLDVRCDDGTEIRGTLSVRPDDAALRTLTHEFAADIRALRASETTTVSDTSPTNRRARPIDAPARTESP